MRFEFHNPVRLIFGQGKIDQIGKLASEQGRKALIVTSGSSGRTGTLQRVINYLREEKMDSVVFDKVKANPLTTMAHEGAALARDEKCDVVVGLGGGSSMDAAKAVAFMAVNEGDVSDYIYGKPGNGALPLVLITTTAGTGSEGNCAGVLTNPETKDKKAIRSPYLYAKASIVDPELFVTLPQRSVSGPGLDALFHSIESYISKKSNPMTEMMALQAVSLLTANLPRVYKNVRDIEAWEKVAWANTLAGMAIDASGTTLPHALEHPISGLLNITHGEGLAAVFPTIMQFTYKAAPQKFAVLAQSMGANTVGMSLEEAAAKSVECIKSILQSVGMTPSLGELGVTEEHLDWLTGNALKTMKANIENNPKVPTKAEIRMIYHRSLTK
ncbi:MAG: iron-containing alcohol dehydrogenase [Veillonellales bacterium]